MILERVEKDGLVKGVYDSSNIIASTYDKRNNDLTIIFKHGGTYTYHKVSTADFLRFETAESQGKVLNSNIKSYPFIKGDTVDPALIVKKIKQLKVEELINFEKEISLFMVECSDDIKTNGSFDLSMVDRLSSMLVMYKQMRG
jgi:hypothetical protein